MQFNESKNVDSISIPGCIVKILFCLLEHILEVEKYSGVYGIGTLCLGIYQYSGKTYANDLFDFD